MEKQGKGGNFEEHKNSFQDHSISRGVREINKGGKYNRKGLDITQKHWNLISESMGKH